MTAADTRTELRELAEGVAFGKIRRSLSDSILPLTAPNCYDCIGVFDALCEAVDEGDETAAGHLLDLLVGVAA